VSTRAHLDSKLAGETVVETFDFISRLGVSETISAQTVTASVYSGVDANPSALVSGSASASGTVVSQAITGGVTGVTYVLLCTITTSAGQTLQLSALLTILPIAT
jgi:flagellar biosynthesis protein FliR